MLGNQAILSAVFIVFATVMACVFTIYCQQFTVGLRKVLGESRTRHYYKICTNYVVKNVKLKVSQLSVKSLILSG